MGWQKKLEFVGLGARGGPPAKNPVAAGHDLAVRNRSLATGAASKTC
jgi:3-hydroxyisobutyrate dehydrogenase-like beta-hydroxyacid dehydrogenase